MNMKRILIALCLSLATLTAAAAEQVKYHLLIQVSEDSIDKMNSALNTARNTQHIFGPENIEIEIVVEIVIIAGEYIDNLDEAGAAVAPVASLKPAPTSDQIFVQVGAFGDKVNASRRLALLSEGGIDNSFIVEDNSAATTLFRVRIGPVANVLQYDLLVEELEALSILDPYLISR